MCLNTTDLDKKIAVKDLFTSLVKILGMPPILSKDKDAKKTLLKKNVWRFLGQIHREMPLSPIFFRVMVQNIETECKGQESVLLFMPETDQIVPITADEILHDLHNLAKIMGTKVDDKEAKKEIDDMVKFQNAINQFANETEQYYQKWVVKEIMAGHEISLKTVTVDDLIQFNHNISWSQYFQGLFTKDQYANWNQSQPSINFMDAHFLTSINEILRSFDTETVFNYIFWRSMKELLAPLNATSDSTEENPQECVKQITEIFKAATARIYFDHFKIDPFELRHDLDIMAETVFSAFKFLVAASDWLDAEEKVQIMNKVNRIKFYSGIPDWIQNNTEIDRRTIPLNPKASQVENMMTMLKMNFDRDLDYVIGLRDVNLEEEPFLQVNAFYTSMSIQLKLGILVPPFYNPKYPLAVKYGGLGYIIGHELVHGFGIDGIKEIPDDAKTWLKDGALKTFQKKMDCIQKQYSSFCFKDQKKCVNGRTTIEENLADIDGLKIGYMAYKFARETAGEEPPLPGLTDLSGDELFFLTLGRMRCSTGGEVEETLRDNDLGEPHPPDQTRLIIPFRNFPAFAKIFKCAVGSNFAPLQTCSIWGSYSAVNRYM
jgi:predicted metalloendopeptidase